MLRGSFIFGNDGAAGAEKTVGGAFTTRSNHTVVLPKPLI